MHKGSEVVGQARAMTTLRYHFADRRGRIYMCGCAPGIRIGERVIFGKKRYGLNKSPKWLPHKWGDAFRVNMFQHRQVWIEGSNF